jgi:hypothetical protein
MFWHDALAEISPLFERQPQSNDEAWMKLKGISHATPNDMLGLSKNQMLLPDLLIMDSTSEASRVKLLDESHMELLSELITIFTHRLLMPFRLAKMHQLRHQSIGASLLNIQLMLQPSL